MNERIKEFAEQAGLGVIHNGIVLTKNVNAAEAFENFALLIVKECCKIISDHPYRPVGVIKRNVKQHFGVEE